MKRFCFIAFAFLYTCYAFAQDRVITKDGDVFDAYRIDIGNTFVYFTKEDKDDAAVQKIAKSEVLMIKKKDGTKINVTENAPSENAASAKDEQTYISVQRTEEELKEIVATNKKLIDECNIFNVEFDQSKAINKDANLCVIGYCMKEESIVHNGDLTISHSFPLYGAGRNGTLPPFCDEGLELNIANHTEKIIYIDLAKCFIVRGLESEAMYVPTAMSTSNTSSTGAGVNLGAVTNALGVGGSVGALAQGVTIGKGNSTTSTTTVYSQRVVAIPPKSTKVLTIARLGKRDYTPSNWFRAEKIALSRQLQDTNLLHFNFGRKFNYGEVYNFEENYQYLNFATHISYSFEESCEHLQSMKMLFYPKYIIGVGSGNKWKGFNWNRKIGLYIKDENAFSFYVVNDAN